MDVSGGKDKVNTWMQAGFRESVSSLESRINEVEE